MKHARIHEAVWKPMGHGTTREVLDAWRFHVPGAMDNLLEPEAEVSWLYDGPRLYCDGERVAMYKAPGVIVARQVSLDVLAAISEVRFGDEIVTCPESPETYSPAADALRAVWHTMQALMEGRWGTAKMFHQKARRLKRLFHLNVRVPWLPPWWLYCLLRRIQGRKIL